MAVTRSCDGKCGGKNPAIGQIHVDVWAENVAAPETSTGKRITRDSCEKCRASQLAEMFKEGLDGLEKDIPRHKTAIEARAESAEADAEIARLERLNLAGPAPFSNRSGAVGNQPQSVEQRIGELRKVSAKAEDRRLRALSEGPITEA